MRPVGSDADGTGLDSHQYWPFFCFVFFPFKQIICKFFGSWSTFPLYRFTVIYVTKMRAPLNVFACAMGDMKMTAIRVIWIRQRTKWKAAFTFWICYSVWTCEAGKHHSNITQSVSRLCVYFTRMHTYSKVHTWSCLEEIHLFHAADEKLLPTFVCCTQWLMGPRPPFSVLMGGKKTGVLVYLMSKDSHSVPSSLQRWT